MNDMTSHWVLNHFQCSRAMLLLPVLFALVAACKPGTAPEQPPAGPQAGQYATNGGGTISYQTLPSGNGPQTRGESVGATAAPARSAALPLPAPLPAPLQAPASAPAPNTTANPLISFITSLVNSFGGSPTTNSGGANAPNITPLPGGSAIADVRRACADAINKYRASIGRTALTLKNDDATNTCMDKQSSDDGARGAAHAHFGACGERAQNECPGWSGDPGSQQVSCLKMMWAEGPGGGHYENMSNSAYTQVACGYATVNGKLWMIQNFW